jgi:hypothetical protein
MQDSACVKQRTAVPACEPHLLHISREDRVPRKLYGAVVIEDARFDAEAPAAANERHLLTRVVEKRADAGCGLRRVDRPVIVISTEFRAAFVKRECVAEGLYCCVGRDEGERLACENPDGCYSIPVQGLGRADLIYIKPCSKTHQTPINWIGTTRQNVALKPAATRSELGKSVL